MDELWKRKVTNTMTPEQRAAQFPAGTFHVSAGYLICSSCIRFIDHTRGNTCKRHLETLIHKSKMEQNRALVQKEPELQSAANDPSKTNSKDGGSLPPSHHPRQSYPPTVSDFHHKEIKKLLSDCSSLSLVCDETTDARDRYVFKLLAVRNVRDREPVKTHSLKAVLLDSVVLESTNSKSISDTVITELSKYEIPRTKISAFVTDHAAHMHKAWDVSLKAKLLNAVHVTCSAHLLNLVCEVWQSQFSSVNALVSAIQKVFMASSSRKVQFAQYLAAKGKSVASPPTRNLPRWNTWFKAALYHQTHLKDYADCFEVEAEFSSSENLSQMVRLSKDPAVRDDLSCLRKYGPHLMHTLQRYESNEIGSHQVTHELRLLAAWLHTSRASETNRNGVEALRKSHEKLTAYMSEDSTAGFRQPAARFFSACQAFDPKHIKITATTPESVAENIRWFKEDSLARAQLDVYLSSRQEIAQFSHPVDYWSDCAFKYPELSKIAIACLSVPVGRVAAERSSSTYSKVVADDRLSIDDEN